MIMKKQDVFVIGYGTTKFGEFYDKNESSLASQSLGLAVENAQIDKTKIQTAFFGSFISGSNSQSSIPLSCIEESNISVPVTRIESGNASGAAAFHQAYFSVLGGIYDCVAVVGVEKLSDYVKTGAIDKILGSTLDYHWEFEMGATVTSQYAILTKAHMTEFGTTLEQLASVPVKNHKNGVHNPNAQFRREISLDRFLNAKKIADPIGRFDPATYCDGSSTVIIASSKFILENPDITSKIPVIGSGQASDSLALHNRESLTELKSTLKAKTTALEIANINIKDVNIAEVHDSYPIGEILAIEDLGFFKKGEGGRASEEGETEINGIVSVNTSGGLKARGDAFGATGIAQIIEIVEQMKENAGKRQVSDLKYGITHNVSGTGSTAVVNIFGKEEVKK
jgi:acetyl-CoA C-acetyltransferase